jgi:hypothetical protein
VPRNWDHVFPESWYPDETPADLAKWQIPSCIPCNSAYGKIESDFLTHIGLCLDPSLPGARSIVEKALRSVKRSAGRDEKDGARRVAKGMRILKSSEELDHIPIESVVPGLGAKGPPDEDPHPILVPAEYFRKMTYKIVRGIYYVHYGKFIEPPFEIDFFLLTDDDAAFVRTAMEKFGTTYEREPGLKVRCAITPEDNTSSIFEITFFGQFKTYASVKFDVTLESGASKSSSTR